MVGSAERSVATRARFGRSKTRVASSGRWQPSARGAPQPLPPPPPHTPPTTAAAAATSAAAAAFSVARSVAAAYDLPLAGLASVPTGLASCATAPAQPGHASMVDTTSPTDLLQPRLTAGGITCSTL